MKNGLTLALATVALVMAGFSAMAAAPTIKDIPDVVIGNEQGMTDANAYIYEDAINLANYISDADNSAEDILVSFEAVTARYKLNGNDSLEATDDPVSPGAKAINKQVVNGESDLDSNPETVTFRDDVLTPLAGGAGETPANYNEVVTIWASDGDKAASKSIIVYTEVNGWDHLSGAAAAGEVLYDIDFTNNADVFTADSVIGNGSTSVTADGICLTVALTGTNLVSWSSPYDFISLTANSVWAVKCTVDSNVTTEGSVPLWDIVLANNDAAGAGGPWGYAGDYYFLDAAGSANAASSTFGRTDFQVWYMPVAGQTPQWNDATTGAMIASQDALNDLRVTFRIVDVDDIGILAQEDAGTLCMKHMTVERYDYDQLTPGDTVYSLDNITSSDVYANDVANNTSFGFSGGNVTMSPSGSAYTTALPFVTPGDGVIDVADGSTLGDDYAVAWEADTLYEITVVASADATAISNPPDLFRVNFDTPGNEILCDSWVSPALGAAGVPKAAAAEYKTIFYSHSPSTAAELPFPVTNYDRIRPKVGLICLEELVLGGYFDSSGTITIDSMTVRKMSAQ